MDERKTEGRWMGNGWMERRVEGGKHHGIDIWMEGWIDDRLVGGWKYGWVHKHLFGWEG